MSFWVFIGVSYGIYIEFVELYAGVCMTGYPCLDIGVLCLFDICCVCAVQRSIEVFRVYERIGGEVMGDDHELLVWESC